MSPRGVGGHKTAGHVETGVVINSEEEGLLMIGWPPLVDETVVLPEFAEAGTAEPAEGAGLLLRPGDQIGEVLFGVGFDAGARAAQAVKAEEFVGDELVVWRVL